MGKWARSRKAIWAVKLEHYPLRNGKEYGSLSFIRGKETFSFDKMTDPHL